MSPSFFTPSSAWCTTDWATRFTRATGDCFRLVRFVADARLRLVFRVAVFRVDFLAPPLRDDFFFVAFLTALFALLDALRAVFFAERLRLPSDRLADVTLRFTFRFAAPFFAAALRFADFRDELPVFLPDDLRFVAMDSTPQ